MRIAMYNVRLRHAPRGACELKSLHDNQPTHVQGHAPHGACELKYKNYPTQPPNARHAPHGACELKYTQRI